MAPLPAISVRRLTETALLPTRKPNGCVWDLYADADVVVNGGSRASVRTGLLLSVEDEQFCGRVVSLSPEYPSTFDVVPGTVDQSRGGELHVTLTNHGTHPVAVCSGEAVAHLILFAINRSHMVDVS